MNIIGNIIEKPLVMSYDDGSIQEYAVYLLRFATISNASISSPESVSSRIASLEQYVTERRHHRTKPGHPISRSVRCRTARPRARRRARAPRPIAGSLPTTRSSAPPWCAAPRPTRSTGLSPPKSRFAPAGPDLARADREPARAAALGAAPDRVGGDRRARSLEPRASTACTAS